jgi:uncharacterized protein YndB with AHSA1/START domain
MSEPLVKEIILDAPLPKVWDAISTLEGFRSWFLPIDDFKPEKGFVFHASCIHENKTILTTLIIKEIEADKKLSFYWYTDDYPDDEGKELISIELSDENGKTKLILTHTGFEDTQAFKDFNLTQNEIEKGWEYLFSKLKELFI